MIGYFTWIGDEGVKIPIFTTQLEKSREATDAANIRAAYAEVMAVALTGATTDEGNVTVTAGASGTYVYTATVEASQSQPDWQNTSIDDIGGLTCGNSAGDIQGINTGSWTITYTESTGVTSITPVVAGP